MGSILISSCPATILIALHVSTRIVTRIANCRSMLHKIDEIRVATTFHAGGKSPNNAL